MGIFYMLPKYLWRMHWCTDENGVLQVMQKNRLFPAPNSSNWRLLHRAVETLPAEAHQQVKADHGRR
jgi:hypothetical protein